MTGESWPTELRVPGARDALQVRLEDGRELTLSAEYLRVFTPSAERLGHGARQVIGGKKAVTITDLTPVGRYAVRIVFSDGHESGIYPLVSLEELARRHDENWAGYNAELAATGLTRERPGLAPAPARRG